MISMHHHIEQEHNPINSFFRYQSLRSFKRQVIALKKRYAENTRDQILKITLDDGLKSQLTAAKILDELNIKGYFYYNSLTATSSKVANVHLVHILLKKLDTGKKYQLYSDLINSADFSVTFDDAKYIYRRQGEFSTDQKIKFLVNYKLINSEVDDILEYYYQRVSDVPLRELNENIYMKRDELRDLQLRGHHIFPHGHSHKILGNMSTTELEFEFSEMANAHETIFKNQYEELCVPFGSIYSWNESCDKIAKSYGIRDIILVDDVKNIFFSWDPDLRYFSREDCCSLAYYEYV